MNYKKKLNNECEHIYISGIKCTKKTKNGDRCSLHIQRQTYKKCILCDGLTYSKTNLCQYHRTGKKKE